MSFCQTKIDVEITICLHLFKEKEVKCFANVKEMLNGSDFKPVFTVNLAFRDNSHHAHSTLIYFNYNQKQLHLNSLSYHHTISQYLRNISFVIL